MGAPLLLAFLSEEGPQDPRPKDGIYTLQVSGNIQVTTLIQELQPPRLATGVSQALRARSIPGVSLGVFLGPFVPRAPGCPKSVPRVSPECQKDVRTRSRFLGRGCDEALFS